MIPDLQALVARHGSYSNIPAAAWIAFDAEVAAWRARLARRAQWNESSADNLTRALAVASAGGVDRCHCGAAGEFYYNGRGRFIGWYCTAHRPAAYADNRRSSRRGAA
jgi:hypothetical protein